MWRETNTVKSVAQHTITPILQMVSGDQVTFSVLNSGPYKHQRTKVRADDMSEVRVNLFNRRISAENLFRFPVRHLCRIPPSSTFLGREAWGSTASNQQRLTSLKPPFWWRQRLLLVWFTYKTILLTKLFFFFLWRGKNSFCTAGDRNWHLLFPLI